MAKVVVGGCTVRFVKRGRKVVALFENFWSRAVIDRVLHRG